jgi:hypothetical protein
LSVGELTDGAGKELLVEVNLSQGGYKIHDKMEIHQVLRVRLKSFQIEQANVPFNFFFSDLVYGIEIFLLTILARGG